MNLKPASGPTLFTNPDGTIDTYIHDQVSCWKCNQCAETSEYSGLCRNCIEKSYGEVTPDETWKRTIIVGGGPSLSDFDFSLLNGLNTLGVNDAALVANTRSLFSLDVRWAMMRQYRIRTFPGESFLAVPDDNVGIIPRAIYLKTCRLTGISTDPTIIRGGSSGYGAFNVAFLKGAKYIWLLGFDYSYAARKHWFPTYSWQKDDTPYLDRWARQFNTAVPTLAARGVKVTTVGLNSRINAFPKISLEDFTASLR